MEDRNKSEFFCQPASAMTDTLRASLNETRDRMEKYFQEAGLDVPPRLEEPHSTSGDRPKLRSEFFCKPAPAMTDTLRTRLNEARDRMEKYFQEAGLDVPSRLEEPHSTSGDSPKLK